MRLRGTRRISMAKEKIQRDFIQFTLNRDYLLECEWKASLLLTNSYPLQGLIDEVTKQIRG